MRENCIAREFPIKLKRAELVTLRREVVKLLQVPAKSVKLSQFITKDKSGEFVWRYEFYVVNPAVKFVAADFPPDARVRIINGPFKGCEGSVTYGTGGKKRIYNQGVKMDDGASIWVDCTHMTNLDWKV